MVKIDEYKIMPNHIHGIIMIVENDNVGADLCVRSGNGHIPEDKYYKKGRVA